MDKPRNDSWILRATVFNVMFTLAFIFEASARIPILIIAIIANIGYAIYYNKTTPESREKERREIEEDMKFESKLILIGIGIVILTIPMIGLIFGWEVVEAFFGLFGGSESILR